MANRPYLFCCDSPDYLDEANWLSIFPGDPEIPYYDARWCMPYSWFFFFKPADLIMYTVAYKESEIWTEPRFFAEKSAALQLFSERRNLLEAVAKSPYSSRKAIDDLILNLSRWPGDYLYMDPTEVIEDTDVLGQENCFRILSDIDNSETPIDAVTAALRRYCWFNYKDESDYLMQLAGTTYTWEHHPY